MHGDSLAIAYNDLLGTTKNTLIYENGSLYSSNGVQYTGKVKGYLKSVTEALQTLGSTAEGKSLVSELQDSENMFTITKGNNSFTPIHVFNAGANLSEIQIASENKKIINYINAISNMCLCRIFTR